MVFHIIYLMVVCNLKIYYFSRWLFPKISYSTLNRKELQRSCAYARQKHRILKDEETQVKVEPQTEQDSNYAVDANETEVKFKSEPEWLDLEALDYPEYKVNHNVTPTQMVPCMFELNGHTTITPMLWGFIPTNHKVWKSLVGKF